MIKTWVLAAVIGLTPMLAACNQTGASSVATMAAARLDPTGLSGTAIGMAQTFQPQGNGPSAPDLSIFAPRLRDVAAGNTARPNPMASVESTMDQAEAMQAMGMATSVAGAAVGGAMTGGASLVASVPQLAMQAAMTGARAERMATMKAQTRASLATTEAERAAHRIVPDEDRPAEAQALLSIIDDAGARSAAWQNPETGASGRITIGPLDPKAGSDALTCRQVKQEWRSGKTTRSGSMAVCRSGGEWYDLS